MIRHIDQKMAFVVLFFLLGLLRCSQDTLSLNGELVAVALLSVLMVVLLQEQRGAGRRVGIAILSVAIIYTKIQAIPLLFLLLASESSHRKELVAILLYVFSAMVAAEVLLYLNGAGLVKNLIYMYVYISTGGFAEAVSPGSSGGLLSRVLSFPGHIGWALGKMARDFSFIYVTVFLILVGKTGTRKNLLSDWKVWLGVTAFTIFAPDRAYEHYFIFLLPFVFRFAGPAIAGVGAAVAGPKEWRFFQAGMAIFLLLELVFSVPGVNPYSWNWDKAFPPFTMSQNMDDVRAIIRRNPGTVLVNGWDYQIDSYLDTYSTWGELPLVMAGAVPEWDYANNLITSKFDYLIDVTDYSGIIRGPEYGLSSQGMEGVFIARYYDLVYDQQGLRLYRRKTGQLPAYVPLRRPQRVPLTLVSSTLGCKDCFPDYTGVRRLPDTDKFGTFYGQGLGVAGDFVVNYIPEGSVSRIKYMVGQNSQDLGIDIYNECADGRTIKRSIDMTNARYDAVNDAYFENGICNTRRIDLHFIDKGLDWQQWVGLLGVDGY